MKLLVNPYQHRLAKGNPVIYKESHDEAEKFIYCGFTLFFGYDE